MIHSQEIAKGLHLLVVDTRKQVDVPLEKLQAMQEIYLQRNGGIYSVDETAEVRYYLRAIFYKFHLANLGLEQLWALSDNKRMQVIRALENSLDRLETSNDELLAISFAFEGFLLQARTFLDFYMLYVCKLLKTGHKGSISRDTFFKDLTKVQQDPFATVAEQVTNYFNSSVFGPPNWDLLHPKDWGTLLVSLRDKIAHRDRLRPSFRSGETLAGGILFDWPTLRDITYDRLCQYMENGMFTMLKDVSPMLYGLEWKPGPYKADFWQ